MPGGNCPGPCNSAYRKAHALYEKAVADHADKIAALEPGEDVPEPPVAPEIRPWPGEPIWCPKCQAILRRELAEIDVLAAMVAVDDPRSRASEDLAGKVGGTPSPRSPSAGMDTIHELEGWLHDWEVVARGGEDRMPRRGFLAQRVTEHVAWLVFALDRILTNEDIAADFGAEIRQRHRELSNFAAAGQANKHRKKRCPRCRLYTLWWTIGEDYIRCVNDDCGRMLTLGEYEELPDAA